jgi:hypothetical protein
MTTKRKSTTGETVQVLPVNRAGGKIAILGTTPLILNRMSQKVWQELLFPKGRKTSAEKRINMKHNPIEEYRNSVYRMEDDAPTAIGILPTSFKNAMAGAAVDIAGATRAQVQRLLWVEGTMIPVFGVPQIAMSVVRCADRARTPDIRTRAILPQWATILDLNWIDGLISEKSVINLLSAAGIIQGVGDWRQEKGSGTYGGFETVPMQDKAFKKVMTMGRKVQLEALEKPEPFDNETRDLLRWFEDELDMRGAKIKAVA